MSNAIDDGVGTTTWTLTYDDNGNLTSKTDGTDTWDFAWDEDNRLISVSLNSSLVVSYLYDSASRLLQRVEGGTTTNYHWDGWDLVREEKTGTVTETTDYLCPQGESRGRKRSVPEGSGRQTIAPITSGGRRRTADGWQRQRSSSSWAA